MKRSPRYKASTALDNAFRPPAAGLEYTRLGYTKIDPQIDTLPGDPKNEAVASRKSTGNEWSLLHSQQLKIIRSPFGFFNLQAIYSFTAYAFYQPA